MLENEKYLGGALLQKNYTIDFLNKKRGKNNGTLPQYYIEDDHEAIIPKDIFMRVQEAGIQRKPRLLAHGDLRTLRRAFPQAALEQPGQENDRLALQDQTGGQDTLPGKDGQRG